MTIIVWVVSNADSMPIEGTEHHAQSPAEAIDLANDYSLRFANKGVVRIHAGTDISIEDLNSLRELAHSRRIALSPVFP